MLFGKTNILYIMYKRRIRVKAKKICKKKKHDRISVPDKNLHAHHRHSNWNTFLEEKMCDREKVCGGMCDT